MSYQLQAVDNVEPVSDSTFEQVGNQGLYNVVTGCGLTYDAADMTVDLAAGVITHNGAVTSVTGGTAAYTLVSDPTNPRWTWLAIDSTGAATQVNGDPAATPSVPELGDNVGVALVYVQAALTIASDATYKIDKRVPVVPFSWQHIDTQVLTTTAASVSFQSINTMYRDFRLTIYVQNDANGKDIYLRLNNDSGNNYDWVILEADGATPGSIEAQGTAQIIIGGGPADLPANLEWAGVVTVSKPLATTRALTTGSGSYLDATPNMHAQSTAGRWANTADLISRIDVLASSNNFAAGTRITLEGIAYQ